MSSLPTTTTTHVPTMVRPDSPAVRPGPIAAGGGIGMRNILTMLLRHIWLMLAIFVLVQMVTWALFVVCFKYLQKSTARGVMALAEQRDINKPDEYRTMDRFAIETRQAEQAMSVIAEDNLDALLKNDPDVKATAWWGAHKDDRKGPLETLKDSVSAAPIRNSTRIEVKVIDPNPKAAQEMCNLIMKFHEGRTREDIGKLSDNDKRVLQNELRPVDSDLKTVEESLIAMRSSKDYDAVNRAQVAAVAKVSRLGDMLTMRDLDVEIARRRMESSALLDPDKYPDAKATPEILQDVNRDPMIASLAAKLQAWKDEKARLITTRDERHPDVINVNAQINLLEKQYEEQWNRAIMDGKRAAVAKAKAEFDAVDKYRDNVKSDYEKALDEKAKLEKRNAEYEAKERERARLAGEKQRLKGLIDNIDLKVSQGTPLLRVAGWAPEPDEISFPKWEIFLAIGLVLGLALAVGLIVLVEVADSSVRTTRDISEQVRLPLLGFVPLVQSGQIALRDLARMVIREPMSMLAESFRQIRTNLLFSAPVDQLTSIAITSAARDEGKTSVATNLAITIALSGRRVLLVDANFRRPALAEVFALGGLVGLSNVLTNQATLAEAAQNTDVPNLAVVVSGPTPPNPAELLGSATMRSFLDLADTEYDLVIFDSPPSLLVSDTLMLATMVDGVVAVVRAGTTSRGMVARMRDQLFRVRAKVLGAVLNAARPTRGGYFRKSQQQYEQYHNLAR